MTIGLATICASCAHLRFDDNASNYRKPVGFVCDAFPEGVPAAIQTGGFDHRKPNRGDHGIRFEMNPGDNLDHYEARLAGIESESERTWPRTKISTTSRART